MKDADFDPAEQTMIKRGGVVAAPTLDLGHFVSYVQDGSLRRIRIGAEGLTVGRHPACDVVFPVAEVSRQHCRLRIEGDAILVHDLGSTNGTFVAGQRISAPMRLGNGSHISVGTFLMRYEQRDEREVEEENRLTTELRQAVEYVRSILPDPIAQGPVQTEWWYVPSSELGGDAFGYQFIDETTMTGFLIDVSGHGLGSGLHAVNVANVLRRRALPGVDFRDPGQVASGLNAMFPMEDCGGLIFTLWCFAYDTVSRTLRFCSAGHHQAFLVVPGNVDPAPVWLRSPSIGMLPPRTWPSGTVTVAPGGRLYIFSDGVFEIEQPDGTQWQIEDLRKFIRTGPVPGLKETQRLYQSVRASAKPGPLADDFSMLILHFP
jgi:serine phosphatase RsbU (regulator of sigma subunit)